MVVCEKLTKLSVEYFVSSVPFSIIGRLRVE